MAKRPRGDGSIRQRPDGLWEARVWADGRQRGLYAKSQKEAMQKLRDAMTAIEQGLPIAPERQTVRQFLTDWLEGVRPTLRPGVYARYEQIMRLHVLPGLGRVRLRKLTPQQLKRLYAAKLEQGLAPRTVGHIHRASTRPWGMPF